MTLGFFVSPISCFCLLLMTVLLTFFWLIWIFYWQPCGLQNLIIFSSSCLRYFKILGSCCDIFICCSHYVVSWPYSYIWAYLSSSQDFRTLRDRWPTIIFSPRCRKLALFQMVLIIACAILKLAKDAPLCNLGQTMPWWYPLKKNSHNAEVESYVLFGRDFLGLQAQESVSQVTERTAPRRWGEESGYIDVCNKGQVI